MVYDPKTAPNPAAWIAAYDDDREALHRAIRDYHERECIAMPLPRRHAEIHALAEDLLARDELDARAKLAELVMSGLDRHEAVHAIGTVLERMLAESRDDDAGAFDGDLREGIASLTVERWLELRAKEPVRSHRPAWIEELADCGVVRGIDQRLRARILSMGAEAVATLVAVLIDELEDPIGDPAATHAAKLLGELGDVQAIDVLVRTVASPDDGSFLRHNALYGLVAIGPPALEAVLAATDASHDAGDWHQILSELRVTDERIFARLVAALPGDPFFIAGCLANYGDPRGIPLIHRVLESTSFTGHRSEELNARELVWALENLGGDLTDSERRKLAVFAPSALFRRWREPSRDLN